MLLFSEIKRLLLEVSLFDCKCLACFDVGLECLSLASARVLTCTRAPWNCTLLLEHRFCFFASHSALAALHGHAPCRPPPTGRPGHVLHGHAPCWPPPADCHGQVLHGHAPCSTAPAGCHGQVLHGRGPCWTPPAGCHGQVLHGRGPCWTPPAGGVSASDGGSGALW